ncbi:MAG: hypothetical protein J5780_01925 [Treponema sp.]|nr:hypothetical protein [Treponema sp.]
MKKLLLCILAAACLSLTVSADESSSKQIWDHGDNKSKMSYENYQIYRVLDAKDAYVVLYAKNGIKMGKCVVPKAWAKTVPRKLQFRKKPTALNPYMTVIKEEGNFLKVWLTMPTSKLDAVWGHVPAGTKLEGTDAETLEVTR